MERMNLATHATNEGAGATSRHHLCEFDSRLSFPLPSENTTKENKPHKATRREKRRTQLRAWKEREKKTHRERIDK